MLQINDITYRIEGRLLFEEATATIPAGHKVGLVGRNGTGKSTLFRMILGEIEPESGSITRGSKASIGCVAQEAPAGPETLMETVLAANEELVALQTEAAIATDPYRIAEIQTRLSDMDAHAAPARAASILAGLGFPEVQQHRACSEFSGGWRMRVALAALLFAEPDILLLDEPTNYLDAEGTIWLESYLRTYPHTVLLISHDRDLLNNVPNAILHLEQRKLTLYTGNYDRFERLRAEKLQLQMSMRKKQEAARRHMQSFVDRFRAKASKARQAQSRLKMLERMQPVAAVVEEHVIPFRFPEPDKLLAPPIIRMEEASVGYDPGRPVLRNISLRIDQDDRIALLGANGNGKSTFAKLLCDRLKVSSGLFQKSKKLKIAYFAQHQLDELAEGMTVYEHFRELMPDATQAQVRSVAGTYGFGADKAQTKVENLSGGEKARLLMAIATFDKPHLIILDEPTNHLDIDAREALMLAINEYPGAVILISHDRHLIEATADRLWLVSGGTVALYEGDMADYRRLLLDESRGRKAMPEAVETDAVPLVPEPDRKAQRREAAKRRESLAPLRKEIDTAEKAIEKFKAVIKACDRALGDPTLYEKDPAKAAEIGKRRSEAESSLSEAEETWLAASEAYETAMADAAE